MRVFVAGSTGAIGRYLVPMLVEAGHDVAGLTRSDEKAEWLREAGAAPVVCDVFDPRLADEVAAFRPDALVNEVTDLPSKMVLLPLKMAAQNRVRTEGYDAVLAAAKAAGVRRYLAQSVAFSLPGASGRAIERLEQATLGYPGVVLRYGYFYGPGTWSAKPGRQKPVVHVEHAAQRTVELLDASPGVYEVVDPE